MEIVEPEPDLNDEQIALVGLLTQDELEDIDLARLSFADRRYYRKVF